MSGFVMGFGPCANCKQPFCYNPHKVPSVRIEGVREPVCGSCMAQVNAFRKERDLPPHPIEPDAYSALPEGDL